MAKKKRSGKKKKTTSKTSSKSRFAPLDLGPIPARAAAPAFAHPELLERARDAGFEPDLVKMLVEFKERHLKPIWEHPAGMVSAQAASADSGQLGAENIVGVDVGIKVNSQGRHTGEQALRLFVRQKVEAQRVHPSVRMFSSSGRFKTDVIESGDIVAYQSAVFVDNYPRPVKGGVEVSVEDGNEVGTLGCLCTAGNNLYILSNNHVIANKNQAQAGVTPITQAGGPMNAQATLRVGILSKFIPLNFGGKSSIDAAIAQTDPKLSSPDIMVIGQINATPMQFSGGQLVQKSGRTTGHTTGQITGINGSVNVGYGSSGSSSFDNVLTISQGNGPGGVFSSPGDSGSLIVTQGTKRPVALLFAGGGTSTFAFPIESVQAALGVKIVDASDPRFS